MDVIRRLRKITGIRKIGHAGTLDPFATGLLICAVGQYTRLLQYAEVMQKSYEATVTFGQDSTTGDPEGVLSDFAAPDISASDLAAIPAKALALGELPVPSYSAIKIAGKRAYQYARAGEAIDMPIRPIQVFDFSILSSDLPNSANYSVTVSKGTYIRALSEWLAQQLGTKGYTTSLRRIAIGNLQVEDACQLDNMDIWQQKAIPVASILGHLPAITMSVSDAKLVVNGGAIAATSDTFEATDIALYTPEGELLAIGAAMGGLVQPKIVLNME